MSRSPGPSGYDAVSGSGRGVTGPVSHGGATAWTDAAGRSVPMTVVVSQPTRPEGFVEPRWARFLFASTTAAWIRLTVGALLVVARPDAGWTALDRWLLPMARRRSVAPTAAASVEAT